MPARRVIALVGVDTGGGHLRLDNKIIVIEKADVMVAADAIIAFREADEDVGGDGRVGERHVGRPVVPRVQVNARRPTKRPVVGNGALVEHVVHEADAIEVPAAVTIFAPDNFAGGGDVVSADDARSLRETYAVPLCQKRVGVLFRAPV